MEQLKHECGVAIIRLRKSLEYYREKYGTYGYGLSKLYLLMEKQHNRGQEAAGVGVVKLDSMAGHEYVFRERAIGSNAIQEIFSKIFAELHLADVDESHQLTEDTPFLGNIYMGHLRYSTTGKSGISYVHPFLRRNNWRSRNLLMCGNFNMTNVEDLFSKVVEMGQHPRIYSDTIVLLEQLGYALDHENHRIYRQYRDELPGPQLGVKIEDNLDMARVLKEASPIWDGGYVICGATGSGDTFALRDPNGIRPAHYYIDDEIVVITSERPAIQTVFGVPQESVKELLPGQAIIINKNNEISLEQINEPGENKRCSFERIYFSRGSDADIYLERKALGENLVPDIIETLEGDLDDAVFSFIPNTAEVAFMGMIQGLEKYLDHQRMEQIFDLERAERLTYGALASIMNRKVRIEKIAIKDIKLRTFIAEGNSRNDLASHVYDVTYGSVRQGKDTLVVIDDSIVRGTTLKQSIVSMLNRLNPKKIVIVSSSPQVRYPDYYGIDMCRLGELLAFRTAVRLLQESGRADVLEEVYHRCIEELKLPAEKQTNCVKAIYAPFTDRDISAAIAADLTEASTCPVDVIYQTIDGLHRAIPGHPGDWYFSGDYPTAGGTRQVNRAYVNYYEGHADRR